MSANNAVTVLRSPWSHRLPLEFACATRGAPDAFPDQQVISSARHGLGDPKEKGHPDKGRAPDSYNSRCEVWDTSKPWSYGVLWF